MDVVMLETLILGVVPGVAAAILWSPILLSSRIRSLFTRLPPGQSTIGSYLLVAIGLSVPFVIGTGVVLMTTSTAAAALSNALLNLAFALTIVYVVSLPLAAGVGLPRLGRDWDPTDYGAGTWLLLVVATVWYTGVFSVPLAFAAVVFALPTG
jgi:hypothetical protein